MGMLKQPIRNGDFADIAISRLYRDKNITY
jgi:hypothetical protein